MKSAQNLGVVGLLTLALMGCRHAKTTQLSPAQAPSINTKPVGAPPSGNPLTAQSQLPLPSLPPATEDASKHAPPPPPKVHHHRKAKPATTPAVTTEVNPGTTTSPVPATQPASQPPATGPELTADATPPPSTSAIGLLSTGDVTAGAQTRQSTADLISSTESGLKNIKRLLESATDQQTASQIQAFLQKAKAALDLNDLDGAHTLATKAKVLLDELTKP
jgi:hypothetical protein